MAKTKTTEETVKDEPKKAKADPDAAIYTYVGGGEDSPRKIKFMGIQTFVRGTATEVTDPQVLAKIKNNPTFIEGEIDLDELEEYDNKAEEDANKQRAKDAALQAAITKKYNKLASKNEEA